MNKRKILMIISSLGGGGAERVFVRLANVLAGKYDVYVFQLFPKDSDYLLSERVKLVGPEMYREGILDRLVRLRRRLASSLRSRFKHEWINVDYNEFHDRSVLFISRFRLREKPDMVLSFMETANSFNAESFGFGKVVMSERNNPVRKGEDYFKNMCQAYSKADKVIFQSMTVRDMFPRGIRRRGIVLPNPVEVSCKATGGTKRIVSVGRLHQQKNQAMLLRAFVIFSENHPGHTLHLYGDGELAESLRALVKDLSLEGKAFLEGYRQDINEAVADAQMFVLSSDYEGMPNSLLEAMMMGLPCVTTAFEGAEEFFGDASVCLMTPPGDEMALAAAMTRLADDEDFRMRLASSGEKYAGRYSVNNVIPQWEKALFGE